MNKKSFGEWIYHNEKVGKQITIGYGMRFTINSDDRTVKINILNRDKFSEFIPKEYIDTFTDAYEAFIDSTIMSRNFVINTLARYKQDPTYKRLDMENAIIEDIGTYEDLYRSSLLEQFLSEIGQREAF